MNSVDHKRIRMNEDVMTLITFITLVPLVYFIPDLINPYLPDNKLMQVVGAVACIVPVISYLVMPLARFLLLPGQKGTNHI